MGRTRVKENRRKGSEGQNQVKVTAIEGFKDLKKKTRKKQSGEDSDPVVESDAVVKVDQKISS